MPRSLTCILIGISLSATVVVGQSSKWSVPRTPDGRPDFQGVWANNGMTPMERPKQFGMRTTMTDAELADLKKKAAAMMDGGDAFFADELITAAIDGKTKFSSTDTQVGNYDQTWLSDRVWDNRTSLIIDPPDGRMPAPAPGAAERARAQAAAAQARGPADRASDLSLGTRCVSYGTPNIRAGYQSYFEITQGPGVVALRSEMIHDARIFSTDSTSPHISPVIRQYHGDSRARWEGDTLVVETNNLRGAESSAYDGWLDVRGSPYSEQARFVERFRRPVFGKLEIDVTLEDEKFYSKAFTVRINQRFVADDEPIEFVCNENQQFRQRIKLD